MRYRLVLLVFGVCTTAALGEFVVWGNTLFAEPNVPTTEPNVPIEVKAEGVLGFSASMPEIRIITPATEIPTFRYRLRYWQDELIDADSWSFYQVFFEVDPNTPEREPDVEFLRQQLAAPPEQMDVAGLTAYFEAAADKINALEQAVQCRTVVWPKIRPPYQPPRRHFYSRSISRAPDSSVADDLVLPIADVPDLLKNLDTAGLLLSVKARYAIGQGDYDAACRWLRAALAHGRQVTTGPDSPLAMAGAVHMERALSQVEAWIRQPGSPSLFRALGDLPRPLVIFSGVSINQRYKESGSHDILEVEPDFLAQSPRIVQRLERLVAMLHCVEAVRLHAALYGGRAPQHLSEITAVRVPLDPVTRDPFDYRLQDDGFVVSLHENDDRAGLEFRYRIIRDPNEPLPMSESASGIIMF